MRKQENFCVFAVICLLEQKTLQLINAIMEKLKMNYV